MYHKCCVPNCKSVRQKVKFHQIPVGTVGESRKLWVRAIVAVSPNITDQIYTVGLHNLFICHEHFERRFITEKNRVLINGYPSLFTEEEIASGVPSKIDPEVAVRDSARAVARDHACTRRFHADHTYVKINNDDKWMEQLIVSGIPDTKEFQPSEARLQSGTHEDHTYEVTGKTITLPIGTQRFEKCIDINPDEKDTTRIEVPPDIEPVPELEETFDPDYEIQVSPSPVPGNEDSRGGAVFSWQREEELIEADDPEEPPVPGPSPPAEPTLALYCDSDPDPDDPKGNADPDPDFDADADLIFDPQPDQAVPSVPAPVDNRCKDCGEVNYGFDFWCVQCAGGALCGACAGRAPHHAHYVLRAPMGRSRARTQAVLTMIRQQLQNQNLSHLETFDDELKLEVKEESAEPPAAECAAAERDPLACEPCDPVSRDEPEFPHDLIELREPASLGSPISLHSPHSPISLHSPPQSPLSPHPPVSPHGRAVPQEPAADEADQSIAENIVEHHAPLRPPRLRKPTDAHEQILSIPTQRKQVSPAEIKRAFLSHIERVVITQNKQLKVDQPHVKLTSQVRENVVTTQHEGPTYEKSRTRLQFRGSQAPMKVISEPSETVTIDQDVADETVEYLEEGFESDIEMVDNHKDDVLDDGDFDDDVLDEDYLLDEDDLEEDDLSDEDRIERNVPGRGVKRKKQQTLPVKGPSESMVRALPSKVVIQVRPLSSLEIRNWTADRKRLRKD